MPVFFDSTNLSPEQKSRWDWAVAEYKRVIRLNVDRQIEAMSPVMLSMELARLPPRRPATIDELRESMLSFSCSAGPGHRKSALFARLLDGKPALPAPPPLSYSFPWYEIIEAPGPFAVLLDGTPQILGSGDNNAIDLYGQLMINQFPWLIRSMNEAATRLINLQRRFAVCNATAEIIAAITEIYSQGPEFIVRSGPWSDYRVYLGHHESVCQRGFFEDTLKGGPLRRLQSPARRRNILDVGAFFLDARIIEVVREGEHPTNRIAALKGAIANDNFCHLGLLKRQLDMAVAVQAIQVAEFEANPRRHDQIRISIRGWQIELA